MNYWIIGTCAGALTFLASTMTVGGVYFRPDCDGEKKFSLETLKHYVKAPFEFGTIGNKVLWGAIEEDISVIDRLKMLQMNWVFTTTVGGIAGLGLQNFLNTN